MAIYGSTGRYISYYTCICMRVCIFTWICRFFCMYKALEPNCPYNVANSQQSRGYIEAKSRQMSDLCQLLQLCDSVATCLLRLCCIFAACLPRLCNIFAAHLLHIWRLFATYLLLIASYLPLICLLFAICIGMRKIWYIKTLVER
jgi:hypothetical protein